MAYTPNTPEDVREMLDAIGVGSIDNLFDPIPVAVRLRRDLDIPDALSEPELVRKLTADAGRNQPLGTVPSFLGAGAYYHHIPAVVDALAGRSEFLTSYTPYQPEASQGTLQAIFEYQTMICELTGMDVSNASHYDGATAAAECALLAMDATRREEIVVPATIHPDTRRVIATYLRYRGAREVEVPESEGRTDLDGLRKAVSTRTAAIVLQTPNFFGLLEEARAVGEIARECGAMFIAVVCPLSLGVIAPPGEYGADIAVGEGQPLGNPISFGGPTFGFVASREKYVRRMPGRIAGVTRDGEGRPAYVLTLQAREQHIRRAKATSNICTNQGLCALRGAIYLATIGKEGLRRVAELCLRKAHYAAEEITRKTPFGLVHGGPFFREFAIEGPWSAADVNRKLYEEGIIGGYDLGDRRLLLAFTEMNSRADIDRLVKTLGEMS